MSNNPRYLHCIYADDVRTEQTGKQFVIGMYQGGMNIHSPLPLTLGQLCVVCMLHTPVDRPISSLKLSVDWNGQTLLQLTPPPEALPKGVQLIPVEKRDGGLIIQALMVLSPFKIDGNGKLVVKAVVDEDQELVSNALHVTHVGKPEMDTEQPPQA